MSAKVILERIDTPEKTETKQTALLVPSVSPVKVEEEDSYDVKSILEYMSKHSAVHERHKKAPPQFSFSDDVVREIDSYRSNNSQQISTCGTKTTDLDLRGNSSRLPAVSKL